ncbi:fibronectin type III domain-containing protein [Flavobacterium antarcticum]|uniref:fibronectin type III domain-containing protein n=1 Tax=Flavobacterium antarcticum TaxID=271155 RepID=UPI0003B40CEE|nr:fibronectin type III domain-containing protein [Flavobacterium antarcticum]
MKKIILTIVGLLFLVNFYAQSVSPKLFIGTTSIKKNICSDTKWVQHEVNDLQEYEQKRKEFREENKPNSYASPGGVYVKETESVIVYEFKVKRSGFNCQPTVHAIIKGPSLQFCEDQLKLKINKIPNEFITPPQIVFRWTGKAMARSTNNPSVKKTEEESSRLNDEKKNLNGSEAVSCPTFDFKISNTPSYNCVALEWWSLSTKTNVVDEAGNFKQSSDSEIVAFTVESRKEGNTVWTTEKYGNNGRNLHTLTGLEPCTRYEIRLTTICANNGHSNPSNILRFTTSCTKPGLLSVGNITNSSASVSNKRLSAAVTYPCNSAAKSQIKIVEYRTSTSNWQTVICNRGETCNLYGLTPATTYIVRARFHYGSTLYSDYTNEVAFSTRE